MPNHVIGVTYGESGGKTPGILDFSIRTKVNSQLHFSPEKLLRLDEVAKPVWT